MHIHFYKSSCCPRCYLTRKYLKEIIAEQYPHITLEIIDVASAPLKSWRDGIRMIPALKTGDHILSGFLINRTDICDFINKHDTGSK